jgi:uncharacterized membrane protein
MRRQPWLVLVFIGAVVGAVFAGVSTYDFVQHLDRQVHNLHCSFIPGVSHAGESGCQVAMMSPYSSVLRDHVWGGIPISLGALSVFAFLVFYVLDLGVTRRKDDPRATGFLALATVLPALTSLVMLAISLSKLGSVCKLCVVIYIASAACLVGALVVWRSAVRARGDQPFEPRPDPEERHRGEPAFVARGRPASSARLMAVAVDTEPSSVGFIAGMFAVGLAFVAVPIALYIAMAPDHERFIGTCEGLPRPDDTYGVMVRIDRDRVRGAPTIEVLDPLCPACLAFEQRLAASGLGDRLDRKAVLFPLDSTCNWMVTEATHPGACTVSEAILCAGDKAPDVIAWAFDEQDRIRAEARTDPAAAARIVKQRFPDLASCVGSPDARSRLNKSMRWIVANNIRVLTPQVFIDRVKLCDEDVDLGLEYTLSKMLERHARGQLSPVVLEKLPGKRAGDGSGSAGDDSASADKSSADKSATDKSATDKSAADSSSSDKSATGLSSSDKSSIDKSGTDKSTTDKPGSDKPGNDASDAARSATDKSASDTSSTPKSGSEKSGSEKSGSEKSGSEKSASEKSAADRPASDKSSTEKSSTEESGTDKSGSDKSGSDKSATAKSAGDTSSTEKSASEKSASEKSATDTSSTGKATPKAPPRKAPPRRPARRPPADKPSTQEPAEQGPVTRPGDVP